jgi:hypothetical protein
MPEVVISLMAAVARKFIPLATPVWYLQSERNDCAYPYINYGVIYV